MTVKTSLDQRTWTSGLFGYDCEWIKYLWYTEVPVHEYSSKIQIINKKPLQTIKTVYNEAITRYRCLFW